MSFPSNLQWGIAWKELLGTGLSEDGWSLDWTTLGTLGRSGSEKTVRARIVAKSSGIWAAEGLVAAANALFAPELGKPWIRSRLRDGDAFKVGETVCDWEGPARLVLAVERPFLNLAAYASGIATSTHELVALVRKACPDRAPRVTSTRKILPGYRDIAISCVMAGGGHSHRVNLSGGVLIKENHIAAAGGIAEAIASARKVAPHGLRIEVEVRDENELRLALGARADGVLLDNFSPAQVRSALVLISKASPRPFVEVSGGINEETISDFAIEGVDVISVGSLTHSVRATDFSLLLENA